MDELNTIREDEIRKRIGSAIVTIAMNTGVSPYLIEQIAHEFKGEYIQSQKNWYVLHRYE